MLHLARVRDPLVLRGLDDQLVVEGAMQRDVDVLVDRARDEKSAVLAVIRGKVGAASAEGDAQGRTDDQHGVPVAHATACRAGFSDQIQAAAVCATVNLVHDSQSGQRVAEPGRWPRCPWRCRARTLPSPAATTQSAPGNSMRLGFRRPHRGRHAVMGQPLRPVAAAQAVDLKFSRASVNLQREEILPLAATRVQPRDLPAARS